MRFAAESGPPQREETAARRAGQRRRRARTPRAKRTEVAGGVVVGAVFCVEVEVDIVRVCWCCRRLMCVLVEVDDEVK